MTLIKKLLSLCFLITLFTETGYAKHILQGELVDASAVHFEVVDGFAFQNAIRVWIGEVEHGLFLATEGTRAKKLHEMVEQLKQTQQSEGGHFYLPLSGKIVRGDPIIGEIIHFPTTGAQEQEMASSSSCLQTKRELDQLKQGLKVLLGEDSRLPAGSID